MRGKIRPGMWDLTGRGGGMRVRLVQAGGISLAGVVGYDTRPVLDREHEVQFIGVRGVSGRSSRDRSGFGRRVQGSGKIGNVRGQPRMAWLPSTVKATSYITLM